MAKASIPFQIVEAIRAADGATLRQLFENHPEERVAHTVFRGATWLGYAAGHSTVEVVQDLIEIGLDVNGEAEYDKERPIWNAAAYDKFESANLLISRGALLDVDASKRNPLFGAIIGRSPRVVQLLLEAGIQSEARYSSNRTKDMDAIAFALFQGQAECAEIIARWRADGDEILAHKLLAEANAIADLNARGEELNG